MILELTYNPNLKFWQTKWQKIVTFLALQDVKHKNIKMMNVLRSWKNWSGIYTKFNPKNWLSSFFFINLFFCVSCVMALSKTILKWNVYIYIVRGRYVLFGPIQKTYLTYLVTSLHQISRRLYWYYHFLINGHIKMKILRFQGNFQVIYDLYLWCNGILRTFITWILLVVCFTSHISRPSGCIIKTSVKISLSFLDIRTDQFLKNI